VPGTLYVVATPIGNLGDLSPRAADVLRTVKAVAAEDTRRTMKLYARLGAAPPAMISLPAFDERARLEPVLARRAGELSGGLKRRLNLAIGLLTQPDVLLLDEPTVGVDAQSRAFLLEQIRSLAAPHRIVIYTSHYMEEVQAICDRVAIIDRGRVVRSGRLQDMVTPTQSLEDVFMSLVQGGDL
jgi:ABC-2 type transport system ATP-binding protein